MVKDIFSIIVLTAFVTVVLNVMGVTTLYPNNFLTFILGFVTVISLILIEDKL